MVVLDAAGGTPTLEEAVKLLAGTLIVLALVAAYLDPDLPGRREVL